MSWLPCVKFLFQVLRQSFRSGSNRRVPQLPDCGKARLSSHVDSLKLISDLHLVQATAGMLTLTNAPYKKEIFEFLKGAVHSLLL